MSEEWVSKNPVTLRVSQEIMQDAAVVSRLMDELFRYGAIAGRWVDPFRSYDLFPLVGRAERAVVRLREARLFAVERLRDAWQVLRHGMPEDES